MKKARRNYFHGYIVAAAGFGVWMISYGTSGTFNMFFVPVSSEFAWTRAETALASSMSTLVGAIIALGMGWLTDKLGPRLVVSIFGAFSGIALLILSQVNSLWQFQLVYALILPIGTSAVIVPVMATISRWFVKRRGLMTGIVQSGVGVGGFIISPLTAWLITNQGWRFAYIILGIISLVGILLCGLYLKREPRDMGLLPDGITESATHADQPKTGQQEIGLSLRQAIVTGQFWVIAGLYFAFGFCRSTFLVHVGPHVQDLGFSLSDAATVVAIISVSSIVGRVGMGRVADMIGNRPALMIAYAATTVDIIWGLITRDLWGLYLYAFIFGFGWGAQAALRFPATAVAFGLRSAGVIMGVMGLFENLLASAFGIWLAGYIFDIAGNYWPVYWVGLGVSIAGIILAGMVKPVDK
jgi:MFS family permease